jgi:polo-like kinase 1
MLTNDSCGVYFNDNSKMLLYPDNINIDYSEKSAKRQEVREKYSIKNYPHELKKKITLLIHFKNYLEGNENK